MFGSPFQAQTPLPPPSNCGAAPVQRTDNGQDSLLSRQRRLPRTDVWRTRESTMFLCTATRGQMGAVHVGHLGKESWGNKLATIIGESGVHGDVVSCPGGTALEEPAPAGKNLG